MNDRIRKLLDQMESAEKELHRVLQESQVHLNFSMKGERVEFEASVKAAHKQLRIGVLKWLGNRPINLLTAPIIYGMIIPMLLLDLCISFYQATCFPVYKIAKVKRSDFIIFDRHHLSYLNIIEKSHCMYCTYGNGLLAYATEIIARTEQYFCPIKHARKMMGRHARYASFLEYGDPTDYQARLEQFRVDLAHEMEAKDKVVCDGKG
jgi:hypothetical protein